MRYAASERNTGHVLAPSAKPDSGEWGVSGITVAPVSVAALRRQPAAIGLGEDWPDHPSETLGFLVMQIARQAKRMTAGIDELLQCVGALPWVADHRDPGAGPHPGDAGPQMRQQQIAMFAGELLHPPVGRGVVIERLSILLLP